MTQVQIGVLVDEAPLSLDEVVTRCAVRREWIIERVEQGVLLEQLERLHATPPTDAAYRFTSHDLRRIRRLLELEQTFDAAPELAGLVADMVDELARLRARLYAAGIGPG